jgi:hypothetical protein
MALENHEKRPVVAQKAVSDMVNSSAFEPQEFIDLFCSEHPTLQQQFTELCLQWLKHCASNKYRTDGRNEYSQKIARKLLKNPNNPIEDSELTVPYI